MLDTNIDSWVMTSRSSYDFDNAIEINLWNGKRNEKAIELEGTVRRTTGEILEVYEDQDKNLDGVKSLFFAAWKRCGGISK